MSECEFIHIHNIDNELALQIATLNYEAWPNETNPIDVRAKNILKIGEKVLPEKEKWNGYIILKDNNNLVGIAYIFPREILTQTGKVTILALASVTTKKELRGKGYGKKVVKKAFSIVDKDIFPHCFFQTTPQVQPFYEKLGAKVATNKIINSKSDNPEKNPFWDPIAMHYSPNHPWFEGTIDLLGPGW